MKLVIGADHAGFELKTALAAFLENSGHQRLDVGTYSTNPVDYPDFALAVGRAVLDGQAERGILICGSGVGASVAANKIVGIRAGLCHDTYSAHQGVEHDNMDVLVLGARVIGTALSEELVSAFLRAKFTNEERHVRRLNKVLAIESSFLDYEKEKSA
jgi:RpiB/LacA/LacB family sugar-phosphate isomerase